MISLNSTPNSFVYLTAVDIGSLLLKPDFFKNEKNIWMGSLKSARSDFEKPNNPRYPDFINSNAFILTNAEKGSLNCNFSSRLTAPEGVFDLNDDLEREAAENESTRKDFSESWIFESFRVDSKGHHDFDINVPDSITNYVVHGFSLSPSIGLGFAAPQRVTVSKPFFVQVDIPYSIRLGETVKVEVSVFNYKKGEKSTKVDVTLLNELNEFEFVNEDCSSFNARKLLKNVLVDSEFGALTTFLIRPRATGQLKLKIKAASSSDSDSIERNLYVQYEGVTHFNSKTFLIDLRSNKYFSHYHTFEISHTEVVPGSAKVGASIVGNVMGSVTDHNLPDSKGLPRFIANIFFLEYTNAIRNLPADIQSTSAELLTAGYQDLIKYRESSGAFGNIWFTAFAAKCLGHAKHWIEIDENILKDSLKYLTIKQTSLNGFMEDKDGKESIALTAYTAIAFLENKHYLKEFKNAIADSIKYLRINAGSISSNYELAITAYALALSNDLNTDKFLETLKKNAIVEDKQWHWDLEMNKSRKESATTKAVQIEIASYALLAYLKAGKAEKSLPILRWLVSNSDTKRISLYAKDTAIAFQALAEASKVFKSDNFKLDFDLIDSKDAGNKASISKTGDHEKHVELAAYTDSVSIMANGSGLATLEIWWKYNTKIVETLVKFDINVKVENIDDDRMNLEVCTHFVPHSNETQSDLAVMEIELPSGYEFDPESKTLLEKANVKVSKNCLPIFNSQ